MEKKVKKKKKFKQGQYHIEWGTKKSRGFAAVWTKDMKGRIFYFKSMIGTRPIYTCTEFTAQSHRKLFNKIVREGKYLGRL